MSRGSNWRGALACMAAMAGTGYASGRELALFFGQLGQASWAGILAGAATAGLLTGALAGWSARCGGASFAAACRRLPGRWTGRLCRAMGLLFLVALAAVMLRAAGQMGEMTLPVRHGALWGIGLALVLALALNLGGMRALPWAGLALALLAGLFYAALALDPRPPRLFLKGDAVLRLEDSVPAALLLGLAYGGMNACAAAGVAARFSGSGSGLGPCCGALLAAVLLCANAALLRGGRQLIAAAAMPEVALSARWGLAGFWLCAALRFLCAAATLAAALGGLAEWLRDDVKC